jgi:hypothetical protein
VNDRPNQTQKRVDHRHYSPSASVHVVHAMHPVVQALIVGVSIAALGFGVYGAVLGRIAERESRLQRLEVDEMKVALQVQGIKIHEGSTP